MRFNVFIVPAIAAMVAAHPTEVSTGGDLVARDEYRWCLGEKINMGSLRKFNWRMRGIDTSKVCQNDGPFPGIKDCLWREGCAPSSGGFNCGLDAPGFAHGGVNVGLGCDGTQVKRCIDQELGISGNTDYVCNTTG